MKIIIIGATGYVGEGVMLEMLRTPQVEKVLSVGRRPVQINQYPLTEEEKAKLIIGVMDPELQHGVMTVLTDLLYVKILLFLMRSAHLCHNVKRNFV